MPEIYIKTGTRDGLFDLTEQIKALIPSDLNDGLCQVFCEHTTAALTINENTDPDVKSDLLGALERLVPHQHSDYRHQEGNSAAHVKSSLLGCSLSIPILHGRLQLGRWQGIYFCEFDGPRNRRVLVQFLKA